MDILFSFFCRLRNQEDVAPLNFSSALSHALPCFTSLCPPSNPEVGQDPVWQIIKLRLREVEWVALSLRDSWATAQRLDGPIHYSLTPACEPLSLCAGGLCPSADLRPAAEPASSSWACWDRKMELWVSTPAWNRQPCPLNLNLSGAGQEDV